MTNEELQSIIEQFDETKLKQQGIFGVYQFGGGPDESYIRANKEGLELFALELLKAATGKNVRLSNELKNIVDFCIDEEWIDENCDTLLYYVELTPDKQKPKPKINHQGTLGNRFAVFGCILTVIVLVIASIMGLGTILDWLFSLHKKAQ